MALSSNGLRTGRAGASDLADQREMIYEAQEEERKRLYTEQMKQECFELYSKTRAEYGKLFEEWYDSDAVPEFGPASVRIELIKAWIAKQQQAPTFLEGMTAPVVGYVQDNAIRWNTDETPATYRAVWNDDSPDSMTLEKINRPA